MTERRKCRVLNVFIAAVWLVNGLLCKILGLVPRHQDIVARILISEYATLLTMVIGFAEIGRAAWILSGVWPKINAVTQIMVVATMNTLETILVPDLLLWGRINAFFALLFILLIYYNEFYLNRKLAL